MIQVSNISGSEMSWTNILDKLLQRWSLHNPVVCPTPLLPQIPLQLYPQNVNLHEGATQITGIGHISTYADPLSICSSRRTLSIILSVGRCVPPPLTASPNLSPTIPTNVNLHEGARQITGISHISTYADPLSSRSLCRRRRTTLSIILSVGRSRVAQVEFLLGFVVALGLTFLRPCKTPVAPVAQEGLSGEWSLGKKRWKDCTLHWDISMCFIQAI